ncbi:hypothetical protein [Streptococcus cuniculi]|uniref:Uncharacterized protein n=1 Tax=Streptococcus cuniculi TaxID=1432788 RepID=A0A4Y9JGI2_9STRE|nr:hypothetical protein [Streptococcus cuniculi]MBF0777364.1 hypothetical protein [Streptococcus cuniculi]TFU98965.1 hypothetical protein E4T82_01255 [Streptococcus cuniculi]
MKKGLSIVLGMFACLVLSACSVRIGEMGERMDEGTSQMIRVYDADEEKVFETKDEDIIDKFGEYVGTAGEEVEGAKIFKEVPADAEVAYHFVVTTRAGHEVDMYVYENVNDIVLKNIPLLGTIRLPLSEQELDWLRHPEKWEN